MIHFTVKAINFVKDEICVDQGKYRFFIAILILVDFLKSMFSEPEIPC